MKHETAVALAVAVPATGIGLTVTATVLLAVQPAELVPVDRKSVV
jgi:hypothetical protein